MACRRRVLAPGVLATVVESGADAVFAKTAAPGVILDNLKLILNGGHYIAPGTINGHAVTFLVDTGASDVNIPARVAAAIGLRRGYPSRAHTANGIITVYNTVLDEVRLHTLRRRSLPVRKLPRPQPRVEYVVRKQHTQQRKRTRVEKSYRHHVSTAASMTTTPRTASEMPIQAY